MGKKDAQNEVLHPYKAPFTVLGKNKQRKCGKPPLAYCSYQDYSFAQLLVTSELKLESFTEGKSSELDSFRSPLAYLNTKKCY